MIIYGAGVSGRQLASNLSHSNEFKLLFSLMTRKFWDGTIDGFPVKSPSFVKKLSASSSKPRELWLAMRNISAEKRIKLINNLGGLPLHIRTLPSFYDLTNHRVSLNDVRELNLDELLGRQPVKPNYKLLQKCIYNKTVLVTRVLVEGIGSEICRQIISNNPQQILLLENSELALYNINSELKTIIKDKNSNLKDNNIIPLLINVEDADSLNHVFKTWRPHTVYHAAAYKHVPIVEHNVISGVKNNVIGTLNCATIAMKHNVRHFVLVSTDKSSETYKYYGCK